MTKGELVLIVVIILSSLILGLWSTIHMTKKTNGKGRKIITIILLSFITIVIIVALIPTSFLLKDRIFFVTPSTPNCNGRIEIYIAEFWKAGQHYSLNIENEEFMLAESFLTDREIYDRKLRGEYCCSLDSCRVEFKLDDKDTIFYISPGKTKRLTVGSFVDGEFLVGTDEDKNFWITM